MPEDYDSLQRRCAPKGLKVDHETKLQAASPAPAPAAAQPAPAGYPQFGVQFAAGPPQAQQQPMAMYAGPGVFQVPRCDSMVRTSGPINAPSMVPGALQRSSSMVRTSAQQEAMLNALASVPGPMQRSPSMVRTSAQHEVLLVPPMAPGPLQRSSSMVRTSMQQDTLVAQSLTMPMPGAPNPFQRSSSMVRTSAEMPSVPQGIATSPMPMAVPCPAASVRVAMQKDTLVASQRGRSPIRARTCPVQQVQKPAPSPVKQVQKPAAGVQYVYHSPHAPNKGNQQSTAQQPQLVQRGPQRKARPSITMAGNPPSAAIVRYNPSKSTHWDDATIATWLRGTINKGTKSTSKETFHRFFQSAWLEAKPNIAPQKQQALLKILEEELGVSLI